LFFLIFIYTFFSSTSGKVAAISALKGKEFPNYVQALAIFSGKYHTENIA